jgi:hypothetical protein
MAADSPLRKIKNAALPYIDRLNPTYSRNASTEEKRKRAEQFEILNRFVAEHEGAIVSAPGSRRIRIEIRPNSALPIRLAERGFKLNFAGTGTRLGGIEPITEVDIIEIDLGK